MYVLSSSPRAARVSMIRPIPSSRACSDSSRVWYSRSMAAIWAAVRSGRFRIGGGLSLTSASLNDGVRGACAPANIPTCRGAGVGGPFGMLSPCGAVGVKLQEERLGVVRLRPVDEVHRLRRSARR